MGTANAVMGRRLLMGVISSEKMYVWMGMKRILEDGKYGKECGRGYTGR